ncbi:DUF922 domain-containing protein [Maribacter aestuarii]|uniref:DUF922 domain-containing protein n=1 Tax=Maribacter aestuarii TaxID=1130723 RepID=UPI00248BEF70|nr:DUF922 domain-containing protein [Maribacter aestuarii]
MDSVVKNIGLLILLFTMVSGGTAQEVVPWDAGKRLSWKDFKGEVPIGVGAAATTASGISYNFSTYYEGTKMMVDYEVNAFFYPEKSWYRPKICNDTTLIHEQLHFDISELFARKMSLEMAKTSFTKNVKAEVRAIYKKTLRELNDFQNRYDDETDYSRNVPQQVAWTKKIVKALSE